MATPFCDFVHDTRLDDLPDDVVAFAKRCILDLLGVAAGGATMPLSAIISDHAADQFGPGKAAARMIFDGRTVSPAGAALAGGMTIDALDAHDGHKMTKGHVGCGVLPAALACLQAEAIEDGGALLEAVVVGYEIGSRAGMALHRTVDDYHTSGAWVAVACAAIGARVLGLDGEQTREAIGTAEYHGPRSQMMRCIDFPTMVKDGSGWGALSGVSAAYLAKSGFTGAPAITVEDAEVADLWDDLGSRWRILEQYFKPQPVCRWAQPPVEAVLTLKDEHGFAGDDIDHIRVASFHEATRLATAHPKNTEEAQYSLPFPTAAAAVYGRVGAEEVSGAALDDPAILRLSDSMTMEEKDEYNDAFPARRIGEVTVVFKDGRELASGPTEARGDPEAPLDGAEIRAKFHALAGPVLCADRAALIESHVDGLDGGSGLSGMLEEITSPLPPR